MDRVERRILWMKLKLLREHYYSTDNITWIPKRGFDSEEDIKAELNLDPSLCHIYKCRFCDKLHTASYPDTRKKNLRL